MAYLSNIPQPNDQKNVSQPQILENFSQIYTVFSVDHASFDSPLGQGKHRQVTFPVNAAAAPGANEIRMYANTGTSGNPELWLRTLTSNYEITTATKAANGYTMTPAGILIKWGSATINNDASGQPQTWTWPATGTDIPFSTQLWALVQVGANPALPNNDVNAIAYVISVANPAQVTYNVWRRNLQGVAGTDRSPFTVWVLAIGVP